MEMRFLLSRNKFLSFNYNKNEWRWKIPTLHFRRSKNLLVEDLFFTVYPQPYNKCWEMSYSLGAPRHWAWQPTAVLKATCQKTVYHQFSISSLSRSLPPFVQNKHRSNNKVTNYIAIICSYILIPQIWILTFFICWRINCILDYMPLANNNVFSTSTNHVSIIDVLFLNAMETKDSINASDCYNSSEVNIWRSKYDNQCWIIG